MVLCFPIANFNYVRLTSGMPVIAMMNFNEARTTSVLTELYHMNSLLGVQEDNCHDKLRCYFKFPFTASKDTGINQLIPQSGKCWYY